MNGFPKVEDVVVGVPHKAGTCNCGCRFTAGIEGVVIETCEDLDLVIAEFVVPCPAGGADKQRSTAFSSQELR